MRSRNGTLVLLILALTPGLPGTQARAQEAKPVGVQGSVGCLKNPKKVERLEIKKPGVYENYLVDGQWGTGNRVKITADNVTLRNCEIFNCGGNGVGVFAKNTVIENCKIHHCLKSTFKEQHDAHGITGYWFNLTIRNCEIFYVSGDAVQLDPDRKSTGQVVIEDCTFWTGPLPADAAGFKKGERPGENAIDTKTPAKGERSVMIVRNCYFHGWNQPAQIGNVAALNLKENVLVKVENCLLRDNEIAFRVRGPGQRGGANVDIKNCAIYDTAVGVRVEDKAENLKIDRLGFGKGVTRKFHILQNKPGPGYENRGEYEPPPFETLLKQGFSKSTEKSPPEECGPADSQETEQATRKTDIAFKIIPGTENGSRAILEKRKAELLERRGGKLQSHDWWLWGLTPMDYDRDGDPDFLVTIHGPNHGAVLKNQFKETGKLTFADVTMELGVDNQLPAATGRRTFAWDFDGDGWLDIVGIGSPHLLNQQGKKFVPLAKSGFSSFNPQAIMDLNGDGHPDFFNNAGQNGLWVPAKQTFELKPLTHPLENKLPEAVQKFWQEAKAKPANRFLRIKFLTDHDLDGDGTPEVIMTGYASYGGDVFARYFRQAKEGLKEATDELGLPTEGVPILLRDLDGDGHLDLLIAAVPSAGFYLNNGKGHFRLQPGPLTDQLKSRDPYLHRAEAVDFDNDGQLDLVVTKPRSGQTVIYANLGHGVFEPLHKLQGWDSDPVAICDLNDDGLVDVAIGGPGDQVTLLFNTTARPGNGCRLNLRMPAPNLYAVGTRVELFRAGDLKKPGARSLRIETAPPDGTTIHLGLGKEQQFDLRITFPGHPPREWHNLEARDRLHLTPEGIQKHLKDNKESK